ncbi:MAG: acyl-CoA dehydrogenase family protein [Actinomycetes bacterium]
MDLTYSPAQAELRDRAAAYADLLMQYEDRAEEAGGPLAATDSEFLRQEAISRGLYGINMPKEWGGTGHSLLEQVIIEEQFGRATNTLWDIPWRPANVLALGTPEQRERYLYPVLRGEKFDAFAVTESGAGSDPLAGVTAAEPADGGWLITGEKWFVTGGDIADFFIVQANVGPELLPTLFLVDKDSPGVRTIRTPRFMHTPFCAHPEIEFDKVFVPADNVLGAIGDGYELTKSWFTDERMMIAARTTGAAERALELARDWSIQRVQFGEPISSYQMIQAMLADCAVDIAVNRAYTHQVAWEADQGIDAKTLHAKASVAKLSASESAGRVIDRCVQIFGGRGYDRAYPVERLYREIRVDRIWEGTSEIQRLIVANELIKRGTGFLAWPTQS